MYNDCEVCSCEFEATNRRGPVPRYCSNACRQKAYRNRHVSTVPAPMRESRRWVRCDGKKRPVREDGMLLSWSHPELWKSYTQVTHANYGTGSGFVLGEGIGVIDLDYCIMADGSLSPLAQNVLSRNEGAWVEYSQSGRGLHVWGLLDGDMHIKERGFEVYAGDAKRFVWVTGKVYRPGSLLPLDVSL